VTEDPILRNAVATQRPELLGRSQNTAVTVSGSRNDTVDLLSQLEECKFVRFHRQLMCEDNEPERCTIPLDLPDAEVFLTTVENENVGFVGGYFDHVAHLPASLWQPDFVELFVEKSLRQSFRNLAHRPDLVQILDGTRTVKRSRELFGFSEEQLPEDYLLFTNIQDDRLMDRQRFSDFARGLYTRMLNVPLADCPNFHLVTPGSVTSVSGANQIKHLLIDLLNTPSAYYLVAREGRMSVIPTTEHGAFFSSNLDRGNGEESSVLSAVITSTLPTFKVPSEFEVFLNESPKIKERDIQRYLEMHPEVLFALDERYSEVRPHVCLVDSKGERLVPDFMARLHGSNLWELIELKMPDHSITVRHGITEKPSAQAARAIAELLAYRDFFSIRANRNRMADRFGTAPYEPCLVLVIGRGRHTERFEWESVRAGFPKIQIVSYDYLFNRVRERRAALSSIKPM
jgi:hypothetical protein